MKSIELRSINIGKVQTYDDNWTTAFFKHPVDTKVWVSELCVDRDEQHHKKYHGGKFRPILAYSAEHYVLWNDELSIDFPYGGFAENFTLSGLDEESACLGDIFQVGDMLKIQVSQPRLPCDQISMRWKMPELTKLVKKSGRTGWYMSVVEEGYAEAGMSLTLLERPYPEWTIANVHEIYQKRTRRPEQALALSQCEALETGWRNRLKEASEKS